MKFTRTIGLLTLAASLALSACGGGGVGTTLNPQTQTTSTAATYTGPAPASPDVQAFEVNLWANINSTNRCGGCHNATTPAQMPNFARADNVNLAYAQANLVVNLQQPSTSMMVTKVAGGHNCWLADPNACGSILTTWITNWANAANPGGATTSSVQLVAPPIQTVGQSLNLPNDGGIDYENTIYTITSVYCSRCHSPNASAPQSPYFAGPVNQISADYAAAIPKIDFTGCVPSGTSTWAQTCGVNSRFYQRLATDNHNCWSNCQADAALMLAQIQAFANMLTPTNIDPTLVISNALTLANGTVASGANRYDADTIAKYEFQTGNGYVAYDTSGVDPSADLTITGNVTWAGGWGLNFGAGGKAQATATGSQKFYNLIQATGEFSVEAWVAPALVAAKNSYMVSYSGSDTTRNFTLAQTNQDYDFMLRNSNTGLNGMPTLETPATADVLQATLQHVVLTYDPVNGRQIWVNGVNTGLVDPQKGGTISDWDQTFALVLGNEVSGDDSWQGLIKFVAIHSRAMTQAQIVQNYNAGVGEQYFMLFNVSSVTGLNESYVMFTVSQFDSYSYLFAKPTFISLDPTVVPNNLPIAGIQIGINGTIPQVGQAYLPLSTTVNSSSYTAQAGQLLSSVGTVIGLENGPLADQFFLAFNQLGGKSYAATAQTYTPPPPVALAPVSDVGVRTFAQINSTLSVLTGVPKTNTAVNTTYQTVQQQLPNMPTLEAYSAANQVGVAQIAVQYCNTMVSTPSYQSVIFPGITFNGSTFSTAAGINAVSSALAARVIGNGSLASQPAPTAITNELNTLIPILCNGSAPCNGNPARVLAVTAAACAAAFGNAEMMIN